METIAIGVFFFLLQYCAVLESADFSVDRSDETNSVFTIILWLACNRAQTHNWPYSKPKLVFAVPFRGSLLRMQSFNATQDTFTLVVLKKKKMRPIKWIQPPQTVAWAIRSHMCPMCILGAFSHVHEQSACDEMKKALSFLFAISHHTAFLFLFSATAVKRTPGFIHYCPRGRSWSLHFECHCWISCIMRFATINKPHSSEFKHPGHYLAAKWDSEWNITEPSVHPLTHIVLRLAQGFIWWRCWLLWSPGRKELAGLKEPFISRL